MFIEIHMLQSFAPSNLNRDDTNNPKDCTFGGVRRARISSQSFKRAVRQQPVFAETVQTYLGVRTKRLVGWLAESLVTQGGIGQEDAEFAASAAITELVGKLDKQQTNVLVYISQNEIDQLSQAIVDQWDAIQGELQQEKPTMDTVKAIIKDFVGKFKSRTTAPDIAMFGRMLANKPDLNVDAACQVAHALSTHRVSMEMDFFTAVDDLQPGEESGAGMMGMTGYNSATFYRYMRIDWQQLVTNLFGDASLAYRTVEGFIRAAVVAIPTGKQTNFAAQNPPDFLLGVVRKDGMCWSLANAFEKPVYNQHQSGLVAPSIEALDHYWGQLQRVYGDDNLMVASSLSLIPEVQLEALSSSERLNLDAWLQDILGVLNGVAS